MPALPIGFVDEDIGEVVVPKNGSIDADNVAKLASTPVACSGGFGDALLKESPENISPTPETRGYFIISWMSKPSSTRKFRGGGGWFV